MNLLHVEAAEGDDASAAPCSLSGGRGRGRAHPRVGIEDRITHTVLAQARALLLDSIKVIPKRLFDAGFKFKFPDLKKALENAVK